MVNSQQRPSRYNLKRISCLLLRVAVLVASVALCMAVYVIIQGIPSPLVRHYMDRIECRQGLRIEINRVFWSPWHLIIAHDIRLSVPDESVSASFDSIELDMRSNRNATRSPMDFRFNASDGRVVIKNTEQVSTSIDVIDCDIDSSAASTRFTVDGALGTGWSFVINGRHGHSSGEQEDSVAVPLGERVSAFGKAAHEMLAGIDKYIERGILPTSLTARVTLDIEAGQPHEEGVWAFLDGGPVQIGDLTLNQCSAAIEWTDDLVRIGSFRVGSPDSGFSLEGRGTVSVESWDAAADLRVRGSPSDLVVAGFLTTNHIDSTRLIGTLDAHLDVAGNLREAAGMRVAFDATGHSGEVSDDVVNLEHLRGSYSNGTIRVESLRLASKYPVRCLPGRWPASLSRAGLRSLGPLRVDVSMGPAPVQAILSNMTGRVTSDKCEYRSAKLEQLSIGFRREDADVRITDARAILQGEHSTRTVQGDGFLLADDGYNMSLTTDAEPKQLAALLPTNVAPLVASFAVHGQSRTEVTLTRAGSAADLALQALVHATDVTRNGVPMDLVHSSLSYSNGMLQVDNLAMVRKDGQVIGQFQYDVSERLFSVGGRSSLPPTELGRFVGPGLERILAPYRIEGPTTIEGKGKFGLKGNPTRDARFHIEGEQLGWRWFLADHAEMDLALVGRATSIDSINAQWCGGQVTGSIRVEAEASTNASNRCGANLQLAGANLASVVDVFHELEDRKAYEGTLSGQLTLSGKAGTNFLRTVTGTGRVNIQNGYILSLPLFGGLSKYLSILVPGLGYATQRDLHSTFQIRDGAVQTDDALLLGKFITIRGKGSYAFDKNLIFRVQVLFLKEGLTATVTRFLTSPLTKALEFELTGSTKEPHWRPVNTPDRLLKLFTEKLGGILPLKRSMNGAATSPADAKR